MSKILFAAAVTMLPIPALALAPETASVASRSAAPAAATLTVTGTFSDGTSRLIDVSSDMDSDGDGAMDQATIQATCDGTHLTHAVISPRDAASGMATGKRMHKPVVFIAAPIGSKLIATYDLKKGTKARTSGPVSAPVTFAAGQPDVCS